MLINFLHPAPTAVVLSFDAHGQPFALIAVALPHNDSGMVGDCWVHQLGGRRLRSRLDDARRDELIVAAWHYADTSQSLRLKRAIVACTDVMVA